MTYNIRYIWFEQLGEFLKENKDEPTLLFNNSPCCINTYGRYSQQEMGKSFRVLDHNQYFDEEGVRLGKKKL